MVQFKNMKLSFILVVSEALRASKAIKINNQFKHKISLLFGYKRYNAQAKSLHIPTSHFSQFHTFHATIHSIFKSFRASTLVTSGLILKQFIRQISFSVNFHYIRIPVPFNRVRKMIVIIFMSC